VDYRVGMRIGIKPGQIGLASDELRRCWHAAEEAGFESVWTFDHLTGTTPCYEATALLAAMAVTTQRVRLGCLVLANGLRKYDALEIPYPSWPERVDRYSEAITRLRHLTGPGTPLAARPHQTPLPLILGGRSPEVRALAREHGLAWNYSVGQDGSVEQFRQLAEGQPDPQVQLFVSRTADVASRIEEYAGAGATRAVLVLTPPVEVSDISRLSHDVGLT
jgi:alkanesulfonate monooxygenase SsuD/methylene tetrahydromethanopterin reductase-like flavin-dependent oxidoreductase (luciferase family)